jgi:hypothetical protein
MLKAVSSSVLPFLKYDLQELAIEENTDNEEPDEEFEFKFLSDVYTVNDVPDTGYTYAICISECNFKAYNAAVFLGYINQSFRPPCDC